MAKRRTKDVTVVGIVATGQTGAARGALDVAIARDLQRGGYCPRGKKWGPALYPGGEGRPHPQPEDGAPPDRYGFLKRHGTSWHDCHARLVLESDATMIFAFGREGGGLKMSELTLAEASLKPYLLLDLAYGRELAQRKLESWLRQIGLACRARARFRRRCSELTLHVGGPRESAAPGIAEDVRVVLGGAIDHLAGLIDPLAGFERLPTGELRRNGQLFYVRPGQGSRPRPFKCHKRVKGCREPVVVRVEQRCGGIVSCCEKHIVPGDGSGF